MPHLGSRRRRKLYYEEVGAGVPIVFVHEFAGDCRSWEPQLRHFGQRYRCIAYNARGFPPSDVPETVEQLFAGARPRRHPRRARWLGIDKAHIVGLSMGGFATLHFGFTYPRPRALAGDRRLRLRRGEPTRARNFPRKPRPRRRVSAIGMAKAAEAYALGPTRVQFQNKDPRGWREFADQLADHSRLGAALTLRGVQSRRPSLYDLTEQMKADHVADPDHDRRRGLGLPASPAS